MVPITLSYLSKAGYGLWSALSSVLAWFFIFDIGIGNGLRNKFTELKAAGKTDEIKYYVSTAYFIFALMALLIIIIFMVMNIFIDWGALLNAPDTMKDELQTTAIIVFVSLSLIFVVRLINTILQADLKSGLSDSFSVIYSIITLIGIIILKRTTAPSLVNFAFLYTGSTLLVTITASVILFKTKYKSYAPKIKYVKLKLARSLASVGVKFFILQIGSLILFQTTGLILSNLIGPESVADYNITMKYYSIAYMAFAILSQPLWTGFGDAYYKNDFGWIRLTFKRLLKLSAILITGLIIMLICQEFIFRIWLKGRIDVSYPLSILFIIYYALQMLAGIYEPFINSTNKLRLQMRITYILIPLFIPVTIYLVKYLGLGPSGILIALILLNGLPATILSMIQSKKILEGASGIWNK